jgi:hypothetical protein
MITTHARTQAGHVGVRKAGYVVHDRSTGIQRGVCDCNLRCVDRDGDALGGKPFDDGNHSADLLSDIHGSGAGARRLAADINDPGSGLDHRDPCRNSIIDSVKGTTVRE